MTYEQFEELKACVRVDCPISDKGAGISNLMDRDGYSMFTPLVVRRYNQLPELIQHIEDIQSALLAVWHVGDNGESRTIGEVLLSVASYDTKTANPHWRETIEAARLLVAMSGHECDFPATDGEQHL